MDILSLVNFMLDCNTQEVKSIMGIVGYVVWGIKVVVPIILIIIGMLDMAKAVNSKSEDEIKKAQQALIKKAIAAVIVFLVPTLVGLIMGVIGADNYKGCLTCINKPGDPSCATDFEP